MGELKLLNPQPDLRLVKTSVSDLRMPESPVRFKALGDRDHRLEGVLIKRLASYGTGEDQQQSAKLILGTAVQLVSAGYVLEGLAETLNAGIKLLSAESRREGEHQAVLNFSIDAYLAIKELGDTPLGNVARELHSQLVCGLVRGIKDQVR